MGRAYKTGLGEKEWEDMHYAQYREMILIKWLIINFPRKILHHV